MLNILGHRLSRMLSGAAGVARPLPLRRLHAQGRCHGPRRRGMLVHMPGWVHGLVHRVSRAPATTGAAFRVNHARACVGGRMRLRRLLRARPQENRRCQQRRCSHSAAGVELQTGADQHQLPKPAQASGWRGQGGRGAGGREGRMGGGEQRRELRQGLARTAGAGPCMDSWPRHQRRQQLCTLPQ